MDKSPICILPDDTGEAVEMLTANLRRVAELVASFRQIVVDPGAEERRPVRLVPYVEEVLEDMGRALHERVVVVTVVGDPNQTIANTNLAQNSGAQVVVQFVLEKDPDVAAQDVRDRVNRVINELPEGTKQPVIEKFQTIPN